MTIGYLARSSLIQEATNELILPPRLQALLKFLLPENSRPFNNLANRVRLTAINANYAERQRTWKRQSFIPELRLPRWSSRDYLTG